VKTTIHALVRLGYFAKAVVYLLMGVLAMRVATGVRGGRITDQGGALYVVLAQPWGRAMLIGVAAGLLTYAAFQIWRAATGRHPRIRQTLFDRALTIVRALVYGAIGVKAMRLVLGLRGGDSGPEPLVRAALRWPFGKWLLMAIGLGIAAYGIVQMLDAIKGRLEPDLDAATIRRRAGAWALEVARAGVGARAVLMVLLAFGLIRAAVMHRARAAGGLDASLTILSALPQGALLLGAAAAGVFAYGIYQLLHARYADL
jgi:hypothetical protein